MFNQIFSFEPVYITLLVNTLMMITCDKIFVVIEADIQSGLLTNKK